MTNEEIEKLFSELTEQDFEKALDEFMRSLKECYELLEEE